LAVAISIEAVEHGFDSRGRQVCEHFSGAEFLQAYASAAISVEFHDAAHAARRAIPSSAFADLAEFFPAHFAICVFIEAIEEAKLLIFRKAGDSGHGLEFLKRKEAVAIRVVFFPNCLKWRAFDTWFTWFGLGVRGEWCEDAEYEDPGNSDCLHGQSGFIGGAQGAWR